MCAYGFVAGLAAVAVPNADEVVAVGENNPPEGAGEENEKADAGAGDGDDPNKEVVFGEEAGAAELL
jgi:hypothetical protein